MFVGLLLYGGIEFIYQFNRVFIIGFGFDSNLIEFKQINK